ncbi:hypothetical protein MRS44_018191 [Fusarium solani]|uniref:uncharacterized protein n=1 Tax=Fusarium solani TaxID=169388 RepID=UPI0032C48C93|nr:hypothetical protein MRS44_018191 [Fusarium solani]
MASRKPRSRASPRPKKSSPRKPGFRQDHPGDPVPAEPRAKERRPSDPVRVGQAMRRKGVTVRHKSYELGKECNTTAVFFFYNTIHGIWEGSVYTPNGKPPRDPSAIVVSDGELVQLTAKERRDMAKAEPYGVQKESTQRKVRRRKPPADAQRASHTSPALTQITVPGSESTVGDRGVSIWSMSDTSASPIVGPLDNFDNSNNFDNFDNFDNNDEHDEHDGPEDDALDEDLAPTGPTASVADNYQDMFCHQQEPHTSPPAVEHNTEGEGKPYETADSVAAALTHDGSGEAIHFEGLQEQPTPHEFSAVMAGDYAWMNIDIDRDIDMVGFQGTMDFGADGLSDLNFDIDIAMSMLSNTGNPGEPQEPPGSYSPKALPWPTSQHHSQLSSWTGWLRQP